MDFPMTFAWRWIETRGVWLGLPNECATEIPPEDAAVLGVYASSIVLA
jgi:hypothetical protein